MVSGVGFQNTANNEENGGRHKKTVSKGLIVAAVLLVLVIIVWIGLRMQNKSLDNKLATLEADTLNVNTQISTALSEEASDSALRAYTMEKELYKEYESNDILNEIENIMVLKSSDGNRVVLKSFQYNAGAYTKKTYKAGSATLKGAGSVTITADADTFDVMAQQIDAFKTSTYFDNVQVGTTDRDDSGRIVFTLTMDVVKYDQSPYESDNMAGVENNQDNMTVDTTEESVDVVGNDNEVNSISEENNTTTIPNEDEATNSADTQITQ